MPKLIVECVQFIESNEVFMKTVGLYRVSGDFKEIEILKSAVCYYNWQFDYWKYFTNSSILVKKRKL